MTTRCFFARCDLDRLGLPIVSPVWDEDNTKLLNKSDEHVLYGRPDLVVPAIGKRVEVRFNEFGKGTVVGYFIEHGWLGILVKVDRQPEWHRKQRGKAPIIHVFGKEVAF